MYTPISKTPQKIQTQGNLVPAHVSVESQYPFNSQIT